jgi:dolichol-phosphate mannosyltransferase
MNRDLSVIIPTFNEKDNIIPLVKAIIKFVNPKEIIVVDDNSKDKTGQIASQYFDRNKCVKVIVNKTYQGLTRSLNIGISVSNCKVISWMDADFSHPPNILGKMYKSINYHDAVIGSWFINGGKDERKNKIEILRSGIINGICRIVLSNKITAFTSGFIMIKKDIFNKYRLTGDYGEYFIHLSCYLIKNNYKVEEVPFVCKPRQSGIAKTSPNIVVFIIRGIKYLVMIIKSRSIDLKSNV